MEQLFQVEYRTSTNMDISRYHYHETYEVILVTQGAATFTVESELILAERGALILIRPGMLHMSTGLTGAPYSRYSLFFRMESLLPFISEQTDFREIYKSDVTFLRLTEKETKMLEQQCRACEEHPDEFGGDLAANMAFLKVMVTIGQILRQDRSDIPLPYTENLENYKRVEPIILYVKEHPTEQMTLESIAEQFFYNKHYLCRVFKNATGVSVGNYIMGVRIRYAASFLRKGHSVLESGQLAGFKNNSNYINTFHRIMGISPGQYKQRYRGKNISV
ncbi:MAG: helix-turn-helix transcriptional regulator [Lachnospiraceae bacterium]|nr:helix-turn-helix transcriptional regulator [Lachnospiraceae bacterium]